MAAQEETVYSKIQNTLLAATDEASSQESRQEECVQRFTDLGLGRGVDATSSKPWLEKSSFQVRRVTFDSLLGTEEGGAVEAYDSLVSSVQTLQLSMKASVMAPTNAGHVKIGIEGEHSRTVSSSRRVVGRRVQNRTIAFIEALDDAPFHCSSCVAEEEHHTGSKGISSQTWPTFEDRLSLWVLERLESEHPALRAAQYLASIRQGISPSHAFEEWYQDAASSADCSRVRYLHSCLGNLCYSFVASLHVTHYVFSVQLGAVEYSVMSEQEYYRTLSQSSSLGLETVVNLGLSMSGKHSRKRQTKTSSTKKIGSIQCSSDKGPFCVPRGTYAEAVIGAEFKPITTLVHHPHLRRALRIATSMYINKQSDSSGGLLFIALHVNDIIILIHCHCPFSCAVGPFLLCADSTTGETVYLAVDDSDMSVRATTKRFLASAFFVIMSDERIYDFHIIYLRACNTAAQRRRSVTVLFSDTLDAVRPLHYYLTTPLSVLGWNTHPLQMTLNPKRTDTLFHLHSRLKSRDPPPEGLGPWVEGREAFFINCYGRRFARDGYLAIKKEVPASGHMDEATYTPLCVPSRKYSEDYYMIFRLVPTTTIDNEAEKGMLETPERSLDDLFSAVGGDPSDSSCEEDPFILEKSGETPPTDSAPTKRKVHMSVPS